MSLSLNFSPQPFIASQSCRVPFHRFKHASVLSPSQRRLSPDPICATDPHHEQQRININPADKETALKIRSSPGLSSGDHLVLDTTLPAGLRQELMPKHVGLILDGNRRWARSKSLPVISGYEAGIRSWILLLELCWKWGIKVLSGFAFSTENWGRPKEEVGFLMGLLERTLRDEMRTFMRKNIRVSVIGDVSALPSSLQEAIVEAEEATRNNGGLQLIIAMSYSGQYDIVQACRQIAVKVKDGFIDPQDVSKSLIEQELQTKLTEFPCPDIIIRTSNEHRLSNYFLWQAAYSELYFAPQLLPDFGEAEFVEALVCFQKRNRRFGST
ncbi:hypothetical protein K2173_016933 [Erythroxylum novogranatense]|uniref:Alkyl transferase n=1 Tax=Erythroxylum novogranatense TaxID=1862640 RepID=A0AAV8U585_9ROSI|nr:hypothetical protein K2173_016933 [Erythroxylum novogranatense]